MEWENTFINNSVTETQFITNLRTRIDEDTEDLMTDIQIKALMLDHLIEICDKTNLIPDFISVAYAGEAYLTLPDDLDKLGSIYVVYSANDKKFLPRTTNNGKFGYTVRGKRLYIYGVTTGLTIEINATRIPKAPADNDDYIDLPLDAMKCLYHFFELTYWQRRRSSEEIQNSYNLYNEAIEKTKEKYLDVYREGVSLYGKNT